MTDASLEDHARRLQNLIPDCPPVIFDESPQHDVFAESPLRLRERAALAAERWVVSASSFLKTPAVRAHFKPYAEIEELFSLAVDRATDVWARGRTRTGMMAENARARFLEVADVGLDYWAAGREILGKKKDNLLKRWDKTNKSNVIAGTVAAAGMPFGMWLTDSVIGHGSFKTLAATVVGSAVGICTGLAATHGGAALRRDASSFIGSNRYTDTMMLMGVIGSGAGVRLAQWML